jgi:hypothetical protein
VTPQDLAYWSRARRRAAGLQPEIASALLRAFAIIRDSLSDAELARLVESGQLDALLNAALSDVVLDTAFIPVRQRIRNTTQLSFRAAIPDLPRGGRINGTIAISFDYLSPKVIEAVRGLDTKVIQSLKDDIREAFRNRIHDGLSLGQGPRTIARSLRDIVGMSPTQAKNADAYEAKLVAEGKLSADQIEKQVAAYRKRAIAVNTETNARTAAIDAVKLGNRLAWQDAIDRGIVDGNRLQKTWIGVMDDRERPTHVAMQGDTVPFDSPFSNGQMIPGDTEYNCRCIARYTLARAS